MPFALAYFCLCTGVDSEPGGAMVGEMRCAEYNRLGARGVRRPRRNWHYAHTHIDGFVGVERGDAGVIFERTSAMSHVQDGVVGIILC